MAAVLFCCQLQQTYAAEKEAADLARTIAYCLTDCNIWTKNICSLIAVSYQGMLYYKNDCRVKRRTAIVLTVTYVVKSDRIKKPCRMALSSC